LVGCSDRADREAAVQKAVAEAQYARVEVEFSPMNHFPGDITCGSYGTVDKWGKETSSQDYIVRNGLANIRPRSEDRQIFCSEQPAVELQAVLGIKWDAPAVQRIYRDLTTLQKALNDYVTDNFSQPTQRQGLAQLVSAGDAPPRPNHYREGGYLEQLPQDPWGRDYIYRASTFGGVAGNAEILTLGADGEEGGSGEDSDISNYHLKYLDHLASL
jgi:general secretion pathway protein G